MYNFTIPMALMDFLPVFLFGATAVLLLRDLSNKMTRLGYVLLAAGSVNVFTAGFCKALWKLLIAANVCDFEALERIFMPINSLGLLLAGLSILIMLVGKKKNALYAVSPVPFTGSVPFIAMMVLGMGGICAGLSALAAKMKKKRLIVLFALSFVLAMGMGYMSSRDSARSAVTWIEQGINTASQLCLLLGVAALHRAKLEQWTWEDAK